MNHENRLELTEEETHDLVRRGIASGRRKLVTHRVVSGVAALGIVGALGVGVFTAVGGTGADDLPPAGPSAPPTAPSDPTPAPTAPSLVPTPAPTDPTPAPDQPETPDPGVDEPAAASHELYDTLGSLLPDGMELSGFSAAEKPFSNPGRWAAFTLSEGADSSTGHVLVGPPGSYGDPDTCQAPACTLTPAGEGQVMFLDGAADDKDGSPASWTFVDPDGMQVTIFLERTDALMDSGLATSIVADGAWAPIVAEEAANPTP